MERNIGEHRLAERLMAAVRDFIAESRASPTSDELDEEEQARPKPMRDLAGASFKEIEKSYERTEELVGLPTGISPDLDRFLGGLRPGQLIALAADRYQGCSSMALQVARQNALAGKVPTLYFTLERSRESLVSVTLCDQAGVDARRVRMGELNQQEWGRLSKAASVLSESELHLCEAAADGVAALRRRALRFAKELAGGKQKLGLVVVDTLIGRGRAAARDARTLKRLARELDAPVVLIVDGVPRAVIMPEVEGSLFVRSDPKRSSG